MPESSAAFWYTARLLQALVRDSGSTLEGHSNGGVVTCALQFNHGIDRTRRPFPVIQLLMVFLGSVKMHVTWKNLWIRKKWTYTGNIFLEMVLYRMEETSGGVIH